jgi:predicted kinase
MPMLFLICGLPGSGKTTAVLALVRDYNALRLAPDEWTAHIVADGWDHERREAAAARDSFEEQIYPTTQVERHLTHALWERCLTFGVGALALDRGLPV